MNDNTSPEQPSTLGTTVRTARQRAGLTIVQLASTVGIHYSVISRIETGHVTHPAAEVVHNIADALDLDPVVLLGFVGVRLPDTVTFLRHRYQLDHAAAVAVTEQLEALVADHQTHTQRRDLS